jgi:hypothetical protein
MEKICHDGDGKTVWHYHAETQSYKGIHPTKGGAGQVLGKYLTDPNLIWQARLTAAGINTAHASAPLYRPCEVAFKLWEHWQEVNSGNANNKLRV